MSPGRRRCAPRRVRASAATRPSATERMRSTRRRARRPDGLELELDVDVVVGVDEPGEEVDLDVADHDAVDGLAEEIGEELVARLLEVRQVRGVVHVSEPVEVAPPDLDTLDRVHRSRSLPHLLLATVVVVWGGSFAAIKALVDHGLDAPDVAIGRYLVAAPGFGIALAVAGGLPGLTRRDAVRLVAAGLFVVTLYHLALNAGERTTTAGTASVVIAAAPAMALTMSLGLGLEAFSRRRAAGLAVAFAGVVVVILLGSGQTVSLDTVRGPLLVLVSASSFAAYNVLVKPLLGRFDAIAISAAASLVGTAALLPFAASGTAGRLGGMSGGRPAPRPLPRARLHARRVRALDDRPALARPVAGGRLPVRRAGGGGRGRRADAGRERDGVARGRLRARRRRGGARAMTEFVWRDGERTIRFGPGAGAHAWPGADVLTTARAESDIPAAVLAGARVHHVPAGQVPDARRRADRPGRRRPDRGVGRRAA